MHARVCASTTMTTREWLGGQAIRRAGRAGGTWLEARSRVVYDYDHAPPFPSVFLLLSCLGFWPKIVLLALLDDKANNINRNGTIYGFDSPRLGGLELNHRRSRVESTYVSICRGGFNRWTQHLTRKLAAYTDSLASDDEESVEANCFRARTSLERIAPGGTCSIAPASSAVYS